MSTENTSILITAPIRDREWVLSHYLQHIYEIEYDKKNIGLLFVLNQSSDRSEAILKEFKRKHSDEYKEIRIENYFGKKKVPKDARVTETRNNHIYSHLTELRNYILSQVGDYDYLFSCDSDILVRPDCLSRLVSAERDIVSSVIYNGYLFSDQPWRFPNILRKLVDGRIEHVANSYVKKAPYATESKLIPCQITGAVYLISRRVAQIIRYAWDKQGEDVPFCLDALSKGFEIWADVGLYSQHIMGPEFLEKYLENKESLY